jgi:hypothetical protein
VRAYPFMDTHRHVSGLLEILYAMVIKGALFLLLPFLSLRQHGHGIWIDKAFTKAREILYNQEVFTDLFLTAAERMTEITGDYSWLGPAIAWANERLFELSDPEVREQLSQQLADYNLRQQEQTQMCQ